MIKEIDCKNLNWTVRIANDNKVITWKREHLPEVIEKKDKTTIDSTDLSTEISQKMYISVDNTINNEHISLCVPVKFHFAILGLINRLRLVTHATVGDYDVPLHHPTILDLSFLSRIVYDVDSETVTKMEFSLEIDNEHEKVVIA